MAKMKYVKVSWIVYFSMKIKDMNQKSNKNWKVCDHAWECNYYVSQYLC
jgi:hypothetical protein